MLVKWKLAFIFGVIFWLGMYIMELLFGNIQSEDLKPLIPSFSIEEEVVKTIEEKPLPDPPELTIPEYIFWTIVSITSSFTLIALSRKVTGYFVGSYKQENVEIRLSIEENEEDSENQIEAEEPIELPVKESPEPEYLPLTNKSSSTTKIPRKINKIPAVLNATTSTNLAEIVRDFKVKTNRKDYQLNSFEKKSADHEFTMSTSRDYLAMVKKAETLVKDKKEYSKKLLEFSKQNQLLKEQLEEITGDKTMLVRRLDCANREIRMNSTSKKLTLDKLNETSHIIEDYKTKIIRLQHEKELMEQKLKQSKELNSSMKEHIEMIHMQNKVEKNALRAVKETSDSVQQSERDIEKVEFKLENLEKSLERIKKTNKPTAQGSKDNNKKGTKETTKIIRKYDQKDQQEYLCMVPECDIPVKDVNFSNVTDTENNPPNFQNDENASNIIAQAAENYICSTIKETEESGHQSESVTDTHISFDQTTSNSGSESDFIPQSGCVTEHPLFQEFLLKNFDGPPTPRSSNLLYNTKKQS